LASNRRGGEQSWQAGAGGRGGATGAVRGGTFKKGEAALQHPMKFRLTCPSGMRRSAKREISWGSR